MLHFLEIFFTEIKLSLESVEGGNWLNILSSVAQLCSNHFTGSEVWASLGWFLFHFGLFCKVWEWKQSHKPKKSHNWIGFLPTNYIRTLPRVSFPRCFNSLIREGKKFICRGAESHYLLFTDVEVKAQKDEVVCSRSSNKAVADRKIEPSLSVLILLHHSVFLFWWKLLKCHFPR